MKAIALRFAAILPTVVLAGLLPAAEPTPRIFLSIEPVLIRGSAIEPLNAPSSDLILVDEWGELHQIIRLGENDDVLMRYKLEFRVESPETLRLTLDRYPGGDEHAALPTVEKTISVLDAWRTPLVERTTDGGRIDLRVTPVIRAPVDDAPFSEGRLMMNFKGGPLVVYGDRASTDRVIFREINVGGARGLRLGVSGVGTVFLSVDPFDGAEPCGWIRGYRLSCGLGGHDIALWSTVQILPEDSMRPGKGWTVYGRLEPDASMGEMDGFYGSFDPQVHPVSPPKP
jgi:hypothetical protein